LYSGWSVRSYAIGSSEASSTRPCVLAVVFVALVVLWARSYWRSDQIVFSRDATLYDISSDYGVIQVESCDYGSLSRLGSWHQGTWESGPTPPTVYLGDPSTSYLFIWHSVEARCRTTAHGIGWTHRYLGFAAAGFRSNHEPAPCRPYRLLAFAVPYYAVCLLASFIFLPLLTQWCRACKSRARRERGCCDACGYDLRGGTARCPECGRDVSAKPSCPRQLTQPFPSNARLYPSIQFSGQS
jgi:hypothetical protein